MIPTRQLGQRWMIGSDQPENAKIIVEVVETGRCKILQVLKPGHDFEIGKVTRFSFDGGNWTYQLLEGQDLPKGKIS